MARALSRAVRVAGIAVAVVAVVSVTSCGQDPVAGPPTVPPGRVSQAAVDEAVAGLCALLATDDATEAARAFEDRAHDTLHAIADALVDADPGAAGAVLEAKEPVESAIADEAPPASYRDDVEALIDATGEAVAELGLTVPSCGG